MLLTIYVQEILLMTKEVDRCLDVCMVCSFIITIP